MFSNLELHLLKNFRKKSNYNWARQTCKHNDIHDTNIYCRLSSRTAMQNPFEWRHRHVTMSLDLQSHKSDQLQDREATYSTPAGQCWVDELISVKRKKQNETKKQYPQELGSNLLGSKDVDYQNNYNSQLWERLALPSSVQSQCFPSLPHEEQFQSIFCSVRFICFPRVLSKQLATLGSANHFFFF